MHLCDSGRNLYVENRTTLEGQFKEVVKKFIIIIDSLILDGPQEDYCFHWVGRDTRGRSATKIKSKRRGKRTYGRRRRTDCTEILCVV